MNEELNHKISQFLDHELHHDEALDLLQKMRSDVGLAEKLSRYEAVSHALKTDGFLLVDADFSSKLAERLKHEPTHLLPRKKTAGRNYQWLALAASVAAVAVLATRPLPNLGGVAAPLPATSSLQVAQRQTPENLPAVAATIQAQEEPLNARINDYLQAHNGSVYANANNPNLKSMARVTTYNQK